jgi:hypothetical protein
MKSGQLFNGKDVPTKDVIVLLSIEEASIIGNALMEYVENNKRKKNAKKLSDEWDSSVPVW